MGSTTDYRLDGIGVDGFEHRSLLGLLGTSAWIKFEHDRFSDEVSMAPITFRTASARMMFVTYLFSDDIGIGVVG